MSPPTPPSDGGEASTTAERKDDHLRLALSDRMQLEHRFFDELAFRHVALPELDAREIDPSVEFLGRRLDAPLLISGMTGGTARAGRINRTLARAAEEANIALGVGSQRAAIEDPTQEDTFRVRELAPGAPLLANLGAVQLNYGFGVDECRRAVEMIEADALVFHLNVLQEAIQPEGQTNFAGLIGKMGEVADALDVPVVAKEIGCGISGEVARALRRVGIEHVDVAGLGGTSWARIEADRADDRPLGELFSDWGIPTPRAVREVAAVQGITVIGSGGLRTGLDAAKAIALGADVVGMAQPFLEPAIESVERVLETVDGIRRELEIAMLCTGSRRPRGLREAALTRRRVR